MENQIDTGSSFWGGARSEGVWAGHRLAMATAMGLEFSPKHLRSAETLRRNEWIAFDNAVMEGYSQRLRAVADLIGAGLTRPIANSFGKTVFDYQRMGDISGANISMDGMVNTENDRPTFDNAQLPIPITHKDWWLNLRTLTASRTAGEPLDTMMTRLAGRTIAEKQEDLLLSGGKTFGGLTIYGYTTHPQRLTDSFTGGKSWDDDTKTGADYLTDLFLMIDALDTNGFTAGPYWLYLPSDASTNLDADFKANSDRTIRERLLSTDRLQRIVHVDKLPTGNAVMIQATPDVVELLQGEPLQTIQWDINGGMQINFKALMIQLPLIRIRQDNKVGIIHLT